MKFLLAKLFKYLDEQSSGLTNEALMLKSNYRDLIKLNAFETYILKS